MKALAVRYAGFAWGFTVTSFLVYGCAALGSETSPCPPSELASLDARYAVEAIKACRAEGADADTCKALPAIRAKYKAERDAWVACGGGK